MAYRTGEPANTIQVETELGRSGEKPEDVCSAVVGGDGPWQFAVSLLAEDLADPDPVIRTRVLRAFTLRPVCNPVVLKRMVDLLADPREEVALGASLALSAQGAPAIPLLVRALTSGGDTARALAALALSGIQCASPVADSALAELARDARVHFVKSAAREALWRRGVAQR